MKIEYSKNFIKKLNKYQKTQKSRYELALYKISLFKNNINHPSLKIHKLKGDKQDFWSFSIEEDLRIIYIYYDSTIIFINIGTHDEVYR